jgi:hypothetical protein
MRARVALAAGTAFAAVAVAGCGVAGQAEEPPDGRSVPPVRDASGCLAGVRAVIRNAPASAGDPATGAWLGRVDHLRDKARALGDAASRELAGELDYAGAQVALDHFPPALAIVPVRLTCTFTGLDGLSGPPSVLPAAQAWLRADPPPARPGMIAGIITRSAIQWGDCPSPRRGSQVAMGGGCEAWSVTLATAAGALRVSCGHVAKYAACTSIPAQRWGDVAPDPGDELYVPASGQVTKAAGVSIISQPPWGNWEAGVAALIKAAENPVGAQ